MYNPSSHNIILITVNTSALYDNLNKYTKRRDRQAQVKVGHLLIDSSLQAVMCKIVEQQDNVYVGPGIHFLVKTNK